MILDPVPGTAMSRSPSTPRQPKSRTAPAPAPPKTDMSWKAAVKTALEKKRPASGFPIPPDRRHK
jgi:hypothetical protein